MPDVPPISHGSVGPVDRVGLVTNTPADRFGRNGAVEDRPSDRVELSDLARFKDRLRSMPDVRVDRVEQVRDAIMNGSYESDAKLNTAIDRLLEELD